MRFFGGIMDEGLGLLDWRWWIEMGLVFGFGVDGV